MARRWPAPVPAPPEVSAAERREALEVLLGARFEEELSAGGRAALEYLRSGELRCGVRVGPGENPGTARALEERSR